jgi:hypothetical protein
MRYYTAGCSWLMLTLLSILFGFGFVYSSKPSFVLFVLLMAVTVAKRFITIPEGYCVGYMNFRGKMFIITGPKIVFIYPLAVICYTEHYLISDEANTEITPMFIPLMQNIVNYKHKYGIPMAEPGSGTTNMGDIVSVNLIWKVVNPLAFINAKSDIHTLVHDVALHVAVYRDMKESVVKNKSENPLEDVGILIISTTVARINGVRANCYVCTRTLLKEFPASMAVREALQISKTEKLSPVATASVVSAYVSMLDHLDRYIPIQLSNDMSPDKKRD